MRRILVAAAALLSLALSSSNSSAKGPASAYHGRGTGNVFWFVHISDTHIGSPPWMDKGATPNLEFVLNKALPVVSPTFVIATGDLTDASSSIGVPTVGQQQDEWDEYRKIYLTAGMTSDFYFDIPGNHDAYGESGELSYFLANSMQGKTNGTPYSSWIVDVPDGEVLFFGLNSEGTGISPMTNPAGNFPDDCLDYYEQTLSAHKDAQLVVVGSHHDLGDAQGADRLIAGLKAMGGGYYLHGHVHAYSEYLAGDDALVVNQINSLGQSKTDNVGIVAYDHNAIVYRATTAENPWPFVVITAPGSVQLRDGGAHPYSYAVCKDRKDNPVRALVFAESAITSVTVQVAGGAAVPMTPAKPDSPLYVGEVDTTAVPVGVYEVAVVAKVGTQEVSHKITTEFVAGPCEDLPVDPAAGGSGGSAGTGGSAGVGGSAGSAAGAGGGGSGGSSGKGGAGGSGGVAGKGGAAGKGGTAGSPAEATDEATADEGGCSCHAAGSSESGSGVWAGLLLGLAAMVRKHRAGVRTAE